MKLIGVRVYVFSSIRLVVSSNSLSRCRFCHEGVPTAGAPSLCPQLQDGPSELVFTMFWHENTDWHSSRDWGSFPFLLSHWKPIWRLASIKGGAKIDAEVFHLLCSSQQEHQSSQSRDGYLFCTLLLVQCISFSGFAYIASLKNVFSLSSWFVNYWKGNGRGWTNCDHVAAFRMMKGGSGPEPAVISNRCHTMRDD